MTITAGTSIHDEEGVDALTIGRRVRQLRTARGLTLGEVAERMGRAPSQLSVIENGKRELKVADVQRLARILGVTVDALLDPEPPSRRAALEIAMERAQSGPLYRALGLPTVPMRKGLSDEALESMLGLHDELRRIHEERAATPEEARRANTELRREMRRRNNHYPELERIAAELLDAVGHRRGPLSQRVAGEVAAYLGFTIHYVGDLPLSTRWVTDTRNGRIYLAKSAGSDARTLLLQALAAHVLQQPQPTGYADYLQQRVETNYLAGAMLVREDSAVAFLTEAKANRELAVEDLRDAFAVSYETAAHRFTNLATEHLGIPVHFLKVHESGAISKAYENDSVAFPTDVLGAVEGQTVCRQWSARKVFEVDDRLSPYHQYTDKPVGTYWCTSQIQPTARGDFSLSVGTPFAHAKWFRGRDTDHRFTSTCPNPACCREPAPELASRWDGSSRASARLASSLFAAMPGGIMPGVDRPDVYAFLERHAPAQSPV